MNENDPRAWRGLTSHTAGLPGAIVQRLRHAEELERAACVLETEFGQLYATSPDDAALDEWALWTLRSRARQLRQLADHEAARSQTRRQELIREARGWIADCQWADIGPDDVADLTDEQVIAGISRYYDGGWAAFRSTV